MAIPTILVTGASGQVGRELMRRHGDRFRAIGLSQSDFDIVNAAAVDAAIKRVRPDAVINAAAYTAVDRAESDAQRALAVNCDGPAHLAAACAAAGIPILHISTDYVFDGSIDRTWREHDPVAPLNAYGRSKVSGENAVRRHPRHVILRTSWVFSPFGHNFVKSLVQMAGERNEVRIVDDQKGRPTPARDIADALLTIAGSLVAGDTRSGTFHFGGAPAVTWYGFAVSIFDELKARGCRTPALYPVTSADYPLPAKRPANSVLDCGTIARVWGIGTADWHDGLRAVLDELLAEKRFV